MDFRKAWFHLLNGEKIKRPHWSGYWAWENGTIMMHCKDGKVLDIRETDDPSYTFDNVAAHDWEVMTMTTKNIKLSPPWIVFYEKINALFKDDPAVKVDYDEDTKAIRLYVEGAEKADALSQLLPTEKTFGDITVKVTVIPANMESPSRLQLFQKAFEGNPAFAYIHESGGIFNFNYVVFKAKVVQYEGDNTGDLNGLTSTLYQDIAKDVFEDVSGVFFCTEPVE